MVLICTLGDPFSINCEAVINSLLSESHSFPILIVGSRWQFEYQAKKLGKKLPPITYLQNVVDDLRKGIYFLDPLPDCGNQPPETLDKKSRGTIAVAALNAIPNLSAQKLAVLTCPIQKSACLEAGFNYPGQTEFFENKWQGNSLMLLAGPKLRVGLVTNHLALKEVPHAINSELIENKLVILMQGLKNIFNIPKPRIAVCGLNPHCSDNGMFGDEESRIITIGVNKFKMKFNSDCQVVGPISADTVFYRAFHGEFDAVLAMYHDQGLGPLKTVHFDTAVNITLGLKHLRVSPDHGPASDLYMTGNASMKSFVEATAVCKNWLN